MDQMPLSLDTPAEDEIAMSAVAGVSAYLPLVFMRDRWVRRWFAGAWGAPGASADQGVGGHRARCIAHSRKNA